MPRRNNNAEPAFTLVELIIVMAVLTTLMAIVAPSLSSSFRHRNLDQQATRLVALTEYGRQEAVSQGVPVVVWVDADKGEFGVEAAEGYTANTIKEKQYTLDSDLRLEMQKGNVMKDGHTQAVQFEPDGSPDASAVDSIQILDRNNDSVIVQLAADGWSYEIAKEDANANSRH